MSIAVTVLGCGSSGGVPRVGQGWGACDPRNPKNRRRRCSILIEKRDAAADTATTVLVDTSPDMREQLLEASVERLDAIVLTHSHADHTHGIDDVRPLVIKDRRRIEIHMDAPTAAVVRSSFGYIFEQPPGSNYPPLLSERRIVENSAVEIDGLGGRLSIMPFKLNHGEIDALGLRFGNCAYTPDVKAVPAGSAGYLENLDVWIIDALRYTQHPSHFSLEEALEWIGRMKPRRAVVTNMHTDLDYEALVKVLPRGIVPAYDGMRIDLDGGGGAPRLTTDLPTGATR